MFQRALGSFRSFRPLCADRSRWPRLCLIAGVPTLTRWGYKAWRCLGSLADDKMGMRHRTIFVPWEQRAGDLQYPCDGNIGSYSYRKPRIGCRMDRSVRFRKAGGAHAPDGDAPRTERTSGVDKTATAGELRIGYAGRNNSRSRLNVTRIASEGFACIGR